MVDPPPVASPPTVALVYFEAGGGHRAAALALREAIAVQQRGWRVVLVNLQEILSPLDPMPGLVGVGVQELYNSLLRRGWTLSAVPLLRFLQAAIRRGYPRQLELLERHWRAHPADLVVSLVPNFNRAVHGSVRRALPGVPSVTVMTDLADFPPHFWLEADMPAVICGSRRAREQALALGLPPAVVFSVSGMILHPRLYQRASLDAAAVAAARRDLGLEPELATGLVLYGGYGSRRMLAIARRLERARLPLQLVLVCGHNQRLQHELTGLAARARMRMRVEGFSHELPRLMACADFMLGKPGPGSVSEAVQSRLPVIVECNLHTLPQERFNAVWLEQQGVGVAIGSLRGLLPAVRRLLDVKERAGMRARAAAIQNRAVWEIPAIFARLLGEPASVGAAAEPGGG